MQLTDKNTTRLLLVMFFPDITKFEQKDICLLIIKITISPERLCCQMDIIILATDILTTRFPQVRQNQSLGSVSYRL